MEKVPGFEIQRDFEFDIEMYPDKQNWYFAKVKMSDFLPRCIRDHLTIKMFMEHHWIRCPYSEQIHVFDAFYDVLGIEKGIDYIFEV